MSRTSKGNAARPGKMVQQKSGLNRAILDQGWIGSLLLAVPLGHTSQTCPCCGRVAKDNRHTQAKFLCVDYGYENHADIVGSINVLEHGCRLLACGEMAHSGRSKKRGHMCPGHRSDSQIIAQRIAKQFGHREMSSRVEFPSFPRKRQSRV
jgi:putative transposase